MTVTITFPENTEEVIDAIRGAIGRDVTFFVVASSIACTVCDLDPTTNTSTDSFCPVCSGVYWIPVWSGFTTSGHITWRPSDSLGWVTGGQFFEGEVRVQVKYTDEIYAVVDTAKYAVVDDKEMRVISKDLRGVKNLNRIIIALDEREK